MTTVEADRELKAKHRALWASGNYPAVATELIGELGPELVRACGMKSGDRVLDVAAGSGNAAIPAAAAGAIVTASDLTPELFEAGRRIAGERGVALEWVEADAEAMPFADNSFDVVMSCVGAMFAPHHQATADELVRVVRPGGTIGMINWTPEGLIGEMFKIMGRYLPAPPDYASPPPLWGSEEHTRELFAGTGVELDFARGHNPWRFESAEHFVVFFETNYGPALKARERLEAEGRWTELRDELHALAERRNEATDGSLLIHAEYLVTMGRKAG